jgi:FtsH-binding integral membrane protein
MAISTHISTPHPHATNALWNPRAAINWSIPFSPAFGSYLQMLNWESLGQQERAAESRAWFYTSIAMLGTYIVASSFFPTSESIDIAGKVLMVAFLAAWYFLSGRTQMKYVEDELGSDYPRRPWGRPITYALVAVVGLNVLFFVTAILIQVIFRLLPGA